MAFGDTVVVVVVVVVDVVVEVVVDVVAEVVVVVDFTVVDDATGTDDVATAVVVVEPELTAVNARTSCGGKPGLVSGGTKDVGRVGYALVIEEPMAVENLLFLMTTVT